MLAINEAAFLDAAIQPTIALLIFLKKGKFASHILQFNMIILMKSRY